MMSLIRIALFGIWSLLAAVPAGAGLMDPPPAGDGADDGVATEKLREALERQIADSRKETTRLQTEAADIQRSISQAPALVDTMRQSVTVISKMLSKESVIRMNLQQLTAQLEVIEAQQDALELALGDVYERIATQQNVPTRAQLEIAELQTAIAARERRIEALKNATGAVEELKRGAAIAERDRLTAEMNVRQIQLEGYQKLLELHTANRDFLSAQLVATHDSQAIVRERFDLLSKDEAARKKAAFAEIEASLTGMPPSVIESALVNSRYNDEILMTEDTLRQTRQLTKRLNSVSQEIKQRYQIAQQQLDIGGYNQLYMDHLRYLAREVKPLLSLVGDVDGLRAALVESRARQFSYDDQLRELRNLADRERKVRRALDRVPSERQGEPGVTAEIQRIYSQREQLLVRLSEVNGNYVVAATSHELAITQLQTEQRKFRTMLSRKMVWLHSSPPIDTKALMRVPEGAMQLLTLSPWNEVLQHLDTFRLRHPLRALIGVAALLLLLYARWRMLPRLQHIAPNIGRVGRDKFRFTVGATLISGVAAMPLPVAIALPGVALLHVSPLQSFAYTLAEPLLRVALVVFVLCMIYEVTRDHGLANVHFRWNERVGLILRRNLPYFASQVPFYVAGMYLVHNAGEQKSIFLFGRVLLLVSNVMLAWMFWRLLKPGHGLIVGDTPEFFDNRWRQRYLMRPMAVGVPLVCAGLLAYGYDFSVISIGRLFYVTLFAGLAIFVLHQIFTRWFAVQERRIAMDRALARRAATQAAKAREGHDVSAAEGAVDVDELDEINLETISERNRGLLTILASAAMLTVLWQLWSDMAPALDILEKVVLWKATEMGELGQMEQVPVTLWRVLCAIFVLVTMVVAGRNLPGLVEVVLLQRFHMDKSIRFAITTVATYVIYAVGLMVASSLLGIAWQKIGWLVAALGVGLGFGLQEIFANFISGIIILIERPIRIGDVVTIGGQSGIVTKIRIRSTTVTDWDQKEQIIPNKSIVTSQLTNWTLTDNMTRLVFPIVVGHSADPEEVVRTLLEVAHSHPMVLKQPAPGAFLTSIGEQTFSFELRAFIPEFTRRTLVTHEINLAITRRMRALGVFPPNAETESQVPLAEAEPL